MEGMNERMGLFPALLDPAKEAAAKLIAENLTAVPVEGKADLMVAPEGTVDESVVFFKFEHEGHRFVLFEQTAVE